MDKQYLVSYEGWLMVTASDEDAAGEIANKMLSDSNIVNDSRQGEWVLTDIDEEEQE
jgi:hypothetical protein